MQRSRPKAHKLKRGKKSEQYKAFENALDLVTLAHIKIGSQNFSCFILGNCRGDLSNIAIKFVFRLRGLNPLQKSEDKFEKYCQNLEDYFKSINSTVTFDFSSFAYKDSPESQKPLPEVSKEVEFLYHDNYIRKTELNQAKQRKSTACYVTVTFKLDSAEKPRDWLDKFLSFLGQLWLGGIAVKRKGNSYQKELTKILYLAHNFALRHKLLLQEAKLKPKSLDTEELVSYLTRNVGNPQAITLKTRILVLDEEGLGSEPLTTNYKNNEADKLHLVTQLTGDKAPVAERNFVYLPALNKFVAVMVLEDKPKGFLGHKHQIQYWWNILSRQGIYDIRLITEITPANAILASLTLEKETYRATATQKHAGEQGRYAVNSEVREEEALDARRRLATGDIPLHTAVILLIYRNTPQELNTSCRQIKGLIRFPAKMVREQEYAWLLWLQSTGLKKQQLLYYPFDRRLLFFSSELAGICNLTQVAKADNRGLELIAHQGANPVYIDFSRPKNIMVLGTTGSGKSLLLASFILECVSLGIPFILLDLPNPDGTGSFKELVLFLGGVYFDISRESNNILQLPNLDSITDEDTRQERELDYIEDVKTVITQLVLGSHTDSLDSFLTQTIQSLIPQGLEAFYEDPAIKQRFHKAQVNGLGSSQWADTPTLRDLIPFYSPEYLDAGKGKTNTEALDYIRLRLQYWLSSPLGRAIGRPSTIESTNFLIAFALTNLNSPEDAAVVSLSAYLASKRQVLSYANSAFFMDEASVLLRFVFLSLLMGKLCATARKQGCRVILAGQDIESIAESAAGVQIVKNTPCKLIGRIESAAGASFTQHLGIPLSIIEENESFQPDKAQFYTRWLLSYKTNFTHCRYYPSFTILALTGNGREEAQIREQFKTRYPDKFRWVRELANHLKSNS